MIAAYPPPSLPCPWCRIPADRGHYPTQVSAAPAIGRKIYSCDRCLRTVGEVYFAWVTVGDYLDALERDASDPRIRWLIDVLWNNDTQRDYDHAITSALMWDHRR